jgi:hypothetical protein
MQVTSGRHANVQQLLKEAQHQLPQGKCNLKPYAITSHLLELRLPKLPQDNKCWYGFGKIRTLIN